MYVNYILLEININFLLKVPHDHSNLNYLTVFTIKTVDMFTVLYFLFL